MFSETVQQILANPTHIGPLEGATHVGVAGVPGDGPYMQIWLECREEGKREEGPGKRDKETPTRCVPPRVGRAQGTRGQGDGERDAAAMGEVIVRAGFRTFGCPSAAASGSMICRLVTGMAVEKAKLLTADDLLLILGGLPEGKEFCATLAVDSLADALKNH